MLSSKVDEEHGHEEEIMFDCESIWAAAMTSGNKSYDSFGEPSNYDSIRRFIMDT